MGLSVSQKQQLHHPPRWNVLKIYDVVNKLDSSKCLEILQFEKKTFLSWEE